MKKLYIFGGIIIAAGLFRLYYLFDPQLNRFFPVCPFRKLFALDCPGCGSQRAIHSLLHGNWMKAMDYNLMLVMSLPFLLIHGLHKLRLMNKDGRWKLIDHPLTPRIILLLVLCFWILRNISLKPFTYLAA